MTGKILVLKKLRKKNMDKLEMVSKNQEKLATKREKFMEFSALTFFLHQSLTDTLFPICLIGN